MEIDRTDPNKGEHGGLLLVANPYYPAKLTDCSILKFSKFSIYCLVTCRSSCFTHVLICNPSSSSPYREPYSLLVECLQACISEFQTHCSTNGIQYFSDNVHFVGDFNFDGINWKTLKGSTSHENEFIVFQLDLHRTQLVMERTHVNGNTLDLAITNCSEPYYSVHSTKVSDPFPVFVYTRINSLEMLPSLPTSKQYSRSSLKLTIVNANLNPLYDFLSNCFIFPLNFVEIWYQ